MHFVCYWFCDRLVCIFLLLLFVFVFISFSRRGTISAHLHVQAGLIAEPSACTQVRFTTPRVLLSLCNAPLHLSTHPTTSSPTNPNSPPCKAFHPAVSRSDAQTLPYTWLSQGMPQPQACRWHPLSAPPSGYPLLPLLPPGMMMRVGCGTAPRSPVADRHCPHASPPCLDCLLNREKQN